MSKRHPKTQFFLQGPVDHPDVETVAGVPDENIWVLLAQYTFNYVHLGKLCRITIPKGFQWDGASIPWFAWTVLRLHPGGKCLLFSLLHDYLYRTEGLKKHHGQLEIPLADVRGKYIFTRWESDIMLRDIMTWQKNEFNPIQIRLCYRVTHRFGKKYFGGPAPTF